MNAPETPQTIYQVTSYRNNQGHKIEVFSLASDLLRTPVKFIGIAQATFTTGVGEQKIDFSFPVDGPTIEDAFSKYLDTRLATAKMIQEDIDKQLRLAKLQGKG